MNDFRSKFLEESIKNLGDLQKRLFEDFSENSRREAFRLVHSLKGSSQTFGLANAARLADELENLLARQEITKNKTLQTSLFEGIRLLISALREKTAVIPASFFKKLRDETLSKSEILLTNLPSGVFRQLSEREKNAVISALSEKKQLFSVKVNFEKTKFAADYQVLREILSKNGEIIAALPNSEAVSKGKIGFDILISTVQNEENLLSETKTFCAEIISFCNLKDSAKGLFEMLSQIAGQTQNSSKKFDLTILSNRVNLSDSMTKTVFEIISQLIRNAVAHAFQDNGEIRVWLFSEDADLFLTVADNGKGIDLEKVRQRAIEKNLILSDDTLNEQQTLELIFASELSTADKVSEISGRGVGLDIVKNSVKKLNGKISVKSRKDFGTKFEINLPLEEI